MSVERVAEIVFAPLAWVAHRLQQNGDDIPDNLLGVAVLFALCSVATVTVAALIGWLAHGALERISRRLNLALKATCRGAHQDHIRDAAELFVRYDRALGALRARTGVHYSVVPPPPGTLGKKGSLAERLRLLLAGEVVAIPARVTSGLGALARWLRHPVGAYLAAGSSWAVLRPDLGSLADRIATGADGVASPTGIAVLAASAAAAAVTLDHGLAPRLRGRNGYVRETAVEAEQILGSMRVECERVVEMLDDAINEVIGAHRSVVGSAVEFATAGACLVLDGTVTGSAPQRRRVTVGLGTTRPDWASSDPLARFRQHRSEDPGGWDSAAPLTDALDQLASCIPDERRFRAVLSQAPARARAIVFAARPRRARTPMGAAVADAPRYLVAATLGRKRLETTGQDLVDDIILRRSWMEPDTTQAEVRGAIQELLDRDTIEQLDALWAAYTFRAQLNAFIAAVHLRHHPRGYTRRLGSG